MTAKFTAKKGQLPAETEEYLHRWFRGTHPLDYTFTKHAELRLQNRRITKDKFWEAFTGQVEIIKFIITHSGEPRVHMRSTKKFKNNKRVTAVFNPTTGEVITVFYIKEIPDPKGKPFKFDIIRYIKEYERKVKNNEQKTKNPA
ncbi:hypothetical protein FINN_54 [Bacillus phage Finn]|uniref:Uncharacterized protein n=1 Tax=Bacillus phage Finn TaxID=2884419 RepID=M1I9D9_9CAUD|nr:hypothetical protein FINN_54 [Bacillus phage Finn]AGE61047.1 hypothetical protein FINN_54 [Bacillus phage Finn]